MLSAEIILPDSSEPLTLSASATRGAPISISVDSGHLDLHGAAKLVEQAQGFDVEGTASWWTNHLEIEARFSNHDNLPETARLRADPFTIPARLLRLGQYADVTGSMNAEWQTNRFAVDLAAKAAPLSNNLPPLEIHARVSGDTNSAQLDVARITAPWIQADLPNETRILFHPPFVLDPVTLRVRADLSGQPWILGARGILTGSAVARPNTGKFPEIAFALSGSNVVVSNVSSRTLELAGKFLWPQVTLTNARIELTDGSKAALAGEFNLQDKSIQGGRLTYSGVFGKQFMPHGVSYGSASFNAQLEGPLNSITNSGTLEIRDLRMPQTTSLQVEARWSGRGKTIQQMEASVAAGTSVLHLRAGADFSGTGEEIGRSRPRSLKKQSR